jgi:iron-sulfur cluster assembly protein
MLTLTPTAAREIQAAALRSGLPDDDWALRIAADVDAEGAIRFGLGFDEEREADLSFTDHGVALLVGAPSRELLTGVTLDFVPTGPDAWGFIFLPPEEQVAPSAGCGSGGCSSGGCASTGRSGCR